MRFSCSKCGQRYQADESFAGEEIECSKCDMLISIPDIEPPPIKITIPEIKKTGIKPDSAGNINIPKLTLPDSLNKKIQDNKAGKISSLSIAPPSGGQLGQNSGNTPSLSMSNSIKERLGQSTGSTPSLGISNQVKEKLGQNTGNTPSLGISNQVKEKLRA